MQDFVDIQLQHSNKTLNNIKTNILKTHINGYFMIKLFKIFSISTIIFASHLSASSIELVKAELERLKPQLTNTGGNIFSPLFHQKRMAPYETANRVIKLIDAVTKNKTRLITAFKNESRNAATDLEAEITRKATGEHVACYEYDDVILLEQTIVNAELILIAAYERAKEGGDPGLINFFKTAFTDHGCLNGRIQFIQRWLDSQVNLNRPTDYCKTILGTHYTNFAASGDQNLEHARNYLISKNLVGARCLDDVTKTPRTITEDDLNKFISILKELE